MNGGAIAVMRQSDYSLKPMSPFDPNDPKVVLYYADWCGHCKTFKPEWEKLKEMCKEKGIKYADYEADRNVAEIEAANIKGFPTIMVNGREYNGPREAKAIFYKLTSKGNDNDDGNGKFKQCGGGKLGFSPRRNGNYYKIKYLKYKAKFMKLKANEDN